MNYSKFIDIATKEDIRNKFDGHTTTINVPLSLKSFYDTANPIDVEIIYPNLGAVSFSPGDELSQLQSSYELSEKDFAFASCNGDPIFLRNEKVFTTLHGTYQPELIADSFEIFIHHYISQGNKQQ